MFIGATGLCLAGYGAVCGERPLRRFGAPMVLLLLLLALGNYTPLNRFLYYYVPGFGRFRSISKFVFFAAVFLAMLAGVGLDRLIRRPRGERRLAAIVAGLAVLLGATGLVVAGGQTAAWWQNVVQHAAASGESYLAPEIYADPGYVHHFGEFAAKGLLTAAGTLLLLSGLLAAMRSFRWTVYLIALLAVVEVFLYAAMWRDTFELAAMHTPALADFLAAHPGDYRILSRSSPNQAMMLGAYDVWGKNDPMMPLRYAELIAYTQGETRTSPYVVPDRLHRFFNLLRLRYVVREREVNPVLQGSKKLPHLLLVQDFRVVKRARCDLCRHERSGL